MSRILLEASIDSWFVIEVGGNIIVPDNCVYSGNITSSILSPSNLLVIWFIADWYVFVASISGPSSLLVATIWPVAVSITLRLILQIPPKQNFSPDDE